MSDTHRGVVLVHWDMGSRGLGLGMMGTSGMDQMSWYIEWIHVMLTR